MVLGECEKMSRTENILLPKKKSLFVGILNMLILRVSHYLLHTIALWVCWVCVRVCVCVCDTVVKSSCRKINVLNLILVFFIGNAYHACNLFRNIENLTKRLCMFLGLY